MCNETASITLEKLEQKVSDSRRKYLIDTREKFNSIKKKGIYCRM